MLGKRGPKRRGIFQKGGEGFKQPHKRGEAFCGDKNCAPGGGVNQFQRGGPAGYATKGRLFIHTKGEGMGGGQCGGEKHPQKKRGGGESVGRAVSDPFSF